MVPKFPNNFFDNYMFLYFRSIKPRIFNDGTEKEIKPNSSYKQKQGNKKRYKGE
jgi:hypothetical protein